MKHVSIIALLLLTACSRDLTIVKNGKEQVVTVKRSEITKETKVVEKTETPRVVEVTRAHCTYVGVCFGCRFNFDGEYECGYGVHSSCDGHRDRTLELTDYTYHIEWQIKGKGTLVSPVQSGSDTKVLKQTECR